jgi:response regulator RpfG family c-di-GMP phosphodiesterase
VRDPLDALTMLSRFEFQVILCDSTMPGLDGLILLEKAKGLSPEARRILISDNSNYVMALDAINRAQVFRLLPKPVSADALRTAVDEALYQYREQKEREKLQNLIREQNTELVVRTLNLDREIHERTASLLNGLVMALDLRDTETQWHSRRVAQYSLAIARSMVTRGEELKSVERGALLHDIGKIGISDSILLKPGQLTPAEWAQMRKHPEMGFRLLEGSDFLERERIIVLHHQERFDGRGYPQGLKARDIDVGARIFAIADTFDAMTSNRPYRKALPFRTAREEIIRCSGAQFDPRIVESFLSVPHTEWTEIRDKIEKGDRAAAAAADAAEAGQAAAAGGASVVLPLKKPGDTE